MFSNKNKIPKSQLPAPTKYTELYYHQTPKEDRKWPDYINVVSIDPAIKNFAIRIEKWDINGIISPIFFTKINLMPNENDSPYITLLNFFSTIKHHFLRTHIFVIEKQLPQNYKCVRVSQHAISIFMTITANTELLPSIYEVDSKLKGDYLGAPKSIGDKDLKKWAVDKAIELCKARGDQFSLDVIEKTKKKMILWII